MRIVPVPCLSDNYAYLLFGDDPHVAWVVDPSEDAPVEAALTREGAALSGILLTHHHPDHTGGAAALAAARPGLAVYGFDGDRARIDALSRPVAAGETFEGLGLSFRALHVPGHTTGALAYAVSHGPKVEAVFTGDTMFVAGCGRLFEGTPAMMWTSLSAIAALGDDVKVYVGHEYTASNLRFAAHVEPGNPDIAAKIDQVTALRARGEATVPSTIADERKTNPFLRSGEASVRRFAGVDDGASEGDVLAKVRAAKDNFK
jgi:hydroxyacylglutathione hydrolase